MNRLFATHLLNDTGIKKAQQIAEAFDDLLTKLTGLVGASGEATREFSIVKTKLEEAGFYAKKSMATQVENQKTT